MAQEEYCYDRLCFEYSDPKYFAGIMDDFGNAVACSWAMYGPLYPYGYVPVYYY